MGTEALCPLRGDPQSVHRPIPSVLRGETSLNRAAPTHTSVCTHTAPYSQWHAPSESPGAGTVPTVPLQQSYKWNNSALEKSS